MCKRDNSVEISLSPLSIGVLISSSVVWKRFPSRAEPVLSALCKIVSSVKWLKNLRNISFLNVH